MAIHINPANRGTLRRALGAKEGRKIPAKKLAKAAESRNPTLKKRAVFAENARTWNHSGGGPRVTPWTGSRSRGLLGV